MASHHDVLEKYLIPVDKKLQPYFLDKAPFQLPNGLREFLVKIAPWFIIIIVIFSVISVIRLVQIIGFLGSLPTNGYNLGITYWLFIAITIVVLILEALAVPHLMKRSLKGWRLIFAATIIGVLSNLIILNVIGLIIGFFISFYILYQIKPLYK